VTTTGETRYVEERCDSEFDEAGNPLVSIGVVHDITERRAAEMEVRRSEENYRNLFFDAPDGYLIIREGVFVECNTAAAVQYGGDREALLGRTPAELSPEVQPDGRPSREAASAYIGTVEREGTASFEWVHRRPDGSEFLAEIRLAKTVYDGEPAILVKWRDVTEQRRAERELRRLSRAVEQSPLSIVITDLEGKIEYANPKAAETTGYLLEELIGRNPRVLQSGETDSRQYETLWSEISGGNEWHGTFLNKKKNGELYWEAATIAPIKTVDGAIDGYVAVKEDITERKQLEDDLKLFRAASDQANYGIAVATLDGTLTYSNDAFAGMHGWRPEEIVGKNLSILHSDDQLQRVMETIEVLKRDGEFAAEEVWRTHRDGSAFPSLMNAKIVRDAAGNPIHMIASAIEISEMKAKESEIKRLSFAIDQSPIAIVITDLDANIQYVSRAFTEITGYDGTDVIGENTRILKSGDTPTEVYEELWETIRSGRTWVGEWTNRKKSGKPYLERVSISPITDETGEITSYLAVKEDITARRAAEIRIETSERRYRQIVETAHEGVWLLDTDDRTAYVNGRLAAMLDIPASEIVGRSFYDFVEESERARIAGLFEERRAGIANSHEQRLRRGDGTYLDVMINANPVFDERGEYSGSLKMVTDISDRRKVEEERVAREVAEAANRSKSAFLANMSHEIRTPMNAILGYAHLIRRDPLTRTQTEQLDKLANSAELLLQVINDVLDLSKIEAGKIRIESQPFQPSRVVDRVIDLVIDRIRRKNVRLDVRINELPTVVDGDSFRLSQILLNLVGNAAKFTEEGTITIRGSVVEGTGADQAGSADGVGPGVMRNADTGAFPSGGVPDGSAGSSARQVWLRFEVSDTGIGMTGEQVKRLFTAFEQADTSTTRRFGGTGLGLAICRRLTELMGGTVAVESALGTGSTFTVEIPFGVSDAALPDATSAEFLANARALVVDDDDDARSILRDMLIGLCGHVDVVSSGEEAVTTVRAAVESGRAYDIVIVDWRMPGMNGLETIEALHRVAPAAPEYVMITAYRDEIPTEESERVGVATVLAKPVTPSQLYDALVGLRHRSTITGEIRETIETGDELQYRRGARVLLVEDNPINQDVGRQLLEHVGIDVTLADNGALAVQAVEESRYDLVLMDIQMPEMDGLEATRAIRKIPGMAALPIIAMTANAFKDDIAGCLEAGMNDHMAKPVAPAELYEHLVRWIPPRMWRKAGDATPAGDRDTRAGDDATTQTRRGITAIDGVEAATARSTTNATDDAATAARDADPTADQTDDAATTARGAAGASPASTDPTATGDPADGPAAYITRLEEIDGLDPALGLKYFNGNADGYLRLLRRVPGQHGEDPQRLRDAAVVGDYRTVREVAHALKGVAATIGMTEVRDAAAALETAAKAKLREGAAEPATATPVPARVPAGSDAIAPLIDRLEGELVHIRRALTETGILEPAEPEPAGITGPEGSGGPGAGSGPASGAGASETGTGTGTGDSEALQRVLHHLAELLEANDVAVDAVLREQSPLLAAAFGKDFPRLRDLVDDFEFEGALEIVRGKLNG